ncbi:MAG: hypothetical protein AAF799_00535 [Myxococcota bacterium]
MSRPRSLARQAVSCLTVSLLFALVVVSGATQYLPPGAANIDHVVVPLVAFPLVWVAFATYTFGARDRRRAWLVATAITMVHAAFIAHGVSS